MKYEVDGKTYRTCPLPMITPQSHRFLELHNHYKAGHLALSGGLLEQPAAYLAAMRIIDNALSEEK